MERGEQKRDTEEKEALKGMLTFAVELHKKKQCTLFLGSKMRRNNGVSLVKE